MATFYLQTSSLKSIDLITPLTQQDKKVTLRQNRIRSFLVLHFPVFLLNLFEIIFAFDIKASHLICSENQMTGCYIKDNIGRNTVK